MQVVGQAAVQGHLHLGAGSLHQLLALTHVDKAAADEIGTGENLSVAAVDGGGHNDDAVLRQVVAVTQDHVAYIADVMPSAERRMFWPFSAI